MTEITGTFTNMTENENGKLESCLSGLSSVTTNLKTVIDYGMQQLKASAVKPRINPWVDAFISINHEVNEVKVSKSDPNFRGTNFFCVLGGIVSL